MLDILDFLELDGGFSNCQEYHVMFYKAELLALHLTPNLEDQGTF